MKTMKSKNIRLTIIIALLTAMIIPETSCNKFLDAKPSKNIGSLISTTNDLNDLLNNYQTYFEEQDNVVIWGTDDNGLNTALAAARPYAFSSAAVQFSCWDVNYLPSTDQASFLGPNFWSNEYVKIYNANTILANVGSVTGSAADKATITADAHFIRAYSYWELANTYCLPYTDANKNEPGLPIKTTPDYTLVGRSTLAATYAQIAADLAEALKTTVHLVQGGVNKFQRANIAGVNGFAARYYLNLNDYTDALKYANASLAEYNTLVDYNTGMYYGTPTTITVNSGAANQQSVTINFPYTHNKKFNDPTDIFGWKEFLYYRMLSNTSNWFIPSQNLLNLYDQQHDLRYKYNIVQNYSYTQGFNNPALSYPAYIFFYNNGMPEGPTTAEMYLIKAECLARTGDIAGAMTAVNQLYSKRTVTGTPPLTATSQEQAITVILQERRREMPFSERWFDIRRFNSNNDPNDDVSLSRTFFTYGQYGINTGQSPVLYTLPKGSRRFASPLPQSDITSSNGLIQQNTY
jgi:hypothetical protein